MCGARRAERSGQPDAGVTGADGMTRSVREALEWQATEQQQRRRSTGAPASWSLAVGAAGGRDMIHEQQARWSVGPARPHHGSLFGAGCVVLGEARALHGQPVEIGVFACF